MNPFRPVHVKYPSIEQFRNCVSNVKDYSTFSGVDAETGKPTYNTPMPTNLVLPFSGTVKIHGTNAAIAEHQLSNTRWFQSRNNIISVDHDNHGFAAFCTDVGEDTINELFIKVYTHFDKVDGNSYFIFGEWCGGNIQKGVAISGLPKMFIIFDVIMSTNDDDDDDRTSKIWAPPEFVKTLSAHKNNIYNVYDFPTYNINIDFNFPEFSQEALKNFTDSVEAECPVGKYFGVSGVGEGIVWKHHDYNTHKKLSFKVKGLEHSVTKVKTLAGCNIESVKNVKEFIERTVTPARLQQGLENIPSVEKQYIGAYIKWVIGDIIKEEHDTMEKNNINMKLFAAKASQMISNFILRELNMKK